MTAPAKPGPTVDAAGKQHSQFFVSVRKRGVLNAMLDGPQQRYDAENPGMSSRWEYCPPNGDKTFIVAREALGFKLIDASELGEVTENGQKEGPVRVGDLVLMAAPEHIVRAIEMEDARAAYEDWRTPQSTYEDNIKGIAVKLKDGTMKGTTPVGDIRVTHETVGAPNAGMGHPLDK